MNINFFKCPNCNFAKLFNSNNLLNCTKCNSNFDNKNYPIFVKETYTDSFGFQWNQFNKTQLDSYNGLTLSNDRLYEVTNWSKSLKGEFILEVGSGSGRFTEVLAKTGAQIYSFDSSSATTANYNSNSSYENVQIFRADIYNIPINIKFDKILCIGVLQHTPNIEESIKSLKNFLSPNGELVFDIYKKNFFHLFQWKYVLRPLTKNINRNKLFQLVKFFSKILYYPSLFTYKLLGKINNRIYPVVYYHNEIKNKKLSIEFSTLDTFDMYSPKYDTPMSIKEIKKLLNKLKLKISTLKHGQNGIICKVTL